MRTEFRDRLVGGLGAVVMIGLLGWALFLGLAADWRRPAEPAVASFTLQMVPPPRVPAPRPRRATKTAHAAAPANLRNEAAAIVALLPPVVPPPPVRAVLQPGAGLANESGAADLPGTGSGAGGPGDGKGGGGEGEGDDSPPSLIRGRLRFSDLPATLKQAGIGGTVSVRYRVQVTGRVTDCAITNSSGNASLDAATCDLIERKFRFDPSRDGNGHPLRSIVTEDHSWIVEQPVDSDR